MKIYSEIRKSAYDALVANWKPAVLATLVVFVVSWICQGFNMCGGPNGIASLSVISFLLVVCVLVPLMYVYNVALFGFYNGYQTDVLKTMIDIFKTKFMRYWVLSLLVALYTFLWGLLFIIPGIIKSYAYSMTPFIAAENPELGSDECIERSMKMMYGHKWELFVLDITFIGWWLLCLITFGIAALFVHPYNTLAHIEFYKELKAEENKEAAAKPL